MSDLFGNEGLIAHKDVGRSDRRTPAKLDVLRAHAGRMIGASWHVADRWGWKISGNRIIDLTAGDAAGDGIHEWIQGSSPAILSSFCRKQPALRVTLIERNQAIFDRLIQNLELRLPDEGFTATSETSWRHGKTKSTVEAFCIDAHIIDFSDMLPNEWLYVFNDPNHMHGWCLDMEAFSRLSGVVPASFMSTMGCNAGGLKRLSAAERAKWKEYIDAAVTVVKRKRRLDLLLFNIKNDSAQWAYLLMVPLKWSDLIREQMVRSFKQNNLDVGSASWVKNQTDFYEVIDLLVTTNEERANR
jgi:hypothetical protein